MQILLLFQQILYSAQTLLTKALSLSIIYINFVTTVDRTMFGFENR